MPDFKTIEERAKWVIDGAEYFTVVRTQFRNRTRTEHPTLAEATAEAQRIVGEDPGARLMIYAVRGPHDTWVKTVTAKPTTMER